MDKERKEKLDKIIKDLKERDCNIPEKLLTELQSHNYPCPDNVSSCEAFYFLECDCRDYEFNFCDRGKHFTIEASKGCDIITPELILKTDNDWQSVLNFMNFLRKAERHY